MDFESILDAAGPFPGPIGIDFHVDACIEFASKLASEGYPSRYRYMYVYIHNEIAQRRLPAGASACMLRPAAARAGSRRGRPSHSESPRIARVAQPRRLERQKSTDKGAREVPRRNFRRFRVDFGIDFHCFSRQHCASDMTRGASG